MTPAVLVSYLLHLWITLWTARPAEESCFITENPSAQDRTPRWLISALRWPGAEWCASYELDSSGKQNCMIYNGGSLCSATLFLHPSRGGETSVRGSASVKRPWNWLPRHCFYRVMCVAGTPVPNESPQRKLSEKWHSHRITEKNSIKSTSLLNEKIKLLPQMHNQEEEENYDLHWVSHNAFGLSLVVVQSDLQPSADTIINPRSLCKHCRRGLSHICNVGAHTENLHEWETRMTEKKTDSIFLNFCRFHPPSYYYTRIALDLKEKLGNDNSVALQLKLTVSINDKIVWSHCKNQNTSQSALHFKHFVFGIKWCWNWRRLHLAKYKLFSVISSSASSWSPKTAHFECLFIWQTHLKSWSV